MLKDYALPFVPTVRYPTPSRQKVFLRAALAALTAGCAFPQDLAGDWQGTLKAGGIELRLVVHISKTETGWKGAMDSLDQGAIGIPIPSVTIEDSAVEFAVPSVHGCYTGKLNAAGKQIDGTWTQGQPLPLKLARMIAAPAASDLNGAWSGTLQAGAVPLRTVLHFTATPAGLAATVDSPDQHDRDETLFGHKPFLVLADYLTRKGIAVLRSDKRGVGKSGGNPAKATSADFAADAEAAFTWLQSRPEIDPQKIGFIGHSEGGMIAPMIAARNPQVAFVVMMAGDGVPGAELLPEQNRRIAEAGGATAEQAAKAAADKRELLRVVAQAKGDAEIEPRIFRPFEKPSKPVPIRASKPSNSPV